VKRASFVALCRPTWQRFESWVAGGESGALRRLTATEVVGFSQAFRAVCHDLAVVRSRGFGRDLDRYLNDLVVRGHSVFYGVPAGQPRAVWTFLAQGFPRLFRAHLGYFALALALFVLPAVLAGVIVGQDASRAVHVLPGTVLEQLEEMYSETARSAHELPSAPVGMSGFYIWNNAGIALRCFATGIFAGAGSLYYLVYNGIFLGTVAGFLLDRGHGERFFSFVVAHGSFELTAIVVAGAAGLRLGHALVHPAPYGWAESLRRRGRAAVQLALGAAAMLVVAAGVEAFWSPLPLPAALKYAAGAVCWLAVVAYLGFAGRTPPAGAP
jgi:uncharacterized membrane protein SpoIIM required for sporulation